MDNEANGESHGFFSSLRSLGNTTVGTLQNRVELFSVELREQKQHTVQLLILAGATLFLSILSLILVTATIIYLFPPEWRVYAFAGFSVLYIAATAILVGKLKSGIRNAPTPFSETISELKKDREWLRSLK